MGFRHAAAKKFNEASVSAKIGTVPMFVRLDGRMKLEESGESDAKESGGRTEAVLQLPGE